MEFFNKLIKNLEFNLIFVLNHLAMKIRKKTQKIY